MYQTRLRDILIEATVPCVVERFFRHNRAYISLVTSNKTTITLFMFLHDIYLCYFVIIVSGIQRENVQTMIISLFIIAKLKQNAFALKVQTISLSNCKINQI